MSGTERDLSRLLKLSIVALCKDAVLYNSRLEVDGIVCVTLDNQTDHVVKIHEFFSKPDAHSDVKSNIQLDGSTCNGTTNQQQSSVTSHVQETVNGPIKVEPDTGVIGTSGGIGDRTPSPPNDCPSLNSKVKTEKVVDISPKSTAGPSNVGAHTPTNLEESKARNITCKKCKSVLDDAKEFESHNMSSHGFFTCMVCLVTFTSRNNMKRHLRLHTGVKPYTCPQCSESFARNDDYKRHLLRHTFEKPFRCTVCKSGYSDRSCVKNHMIKEHKTKVFHICPQCGESYIDAQLFQLHKKTHPEFQDYRCSLCSFIGSNALMYNKHMLTHGIPKRYKCGHCEVPFNDPFSYTNHMKRHKGDELVQSYKCCFCDHVSHTYEQFQRHEHFHIKSKQHTCTVCEKQFRYPATLKEHMFTHVSRSEVPVYSGGACSDITVETNKGSVHDAGKGESDTSTDRSLSYDRTEELKEGQLEAEGSNGLDYWCTECNQGFGTENLLQDHIMSTHEDLNGMTESPMNLTETKNTEKHESEVSAIDLSQRHVNESEEINPYELNTQPDSPMAAFEDTNTAMSRKREPDEETVIDTGTAYDEPTITDSSSFNVALAQRKRGNGHRKQSVTQITKRPRIFDEETVVDADISYQEDIYMETNSQERGKAVDLSDMEINIVNNAVREVERIQSMFGTGQTLNPKSASSSLKGTKNRFSNAQSENTGQKLQNQATRIFKSPASVKKIRPGNYDRNRDTPASIAIPPQPKTTAKMVTLRDAQLDANGNETVSPETVFKNSLNSSTVDRISDDSPQHQYSKSSVLGMDTEFSTTPNRKSPTTLNLQMKSAGFEKVITPNKLFSDCHPFTCEICTETFQDFDGFDQHGITVHRRYICSYCGKTFTSRPNRERHVRYHTGEKPYKCDVCTASFYRGDDLKYHRTSKHSEVRPFLCATCNMSFALPKELEKHLRVYPDHRMKESESF